MLPRSFHTKGAQVITLSFLAAGTAQTGSPLGLLLPLVLMGGVFYFLLIRPQRAQRQRQQALLRALEVGDEVMTAGGMYGTLTEIDDDTDTVTVEIAPGTRVRMLRRAITQRLTEEEDAYDDEEDDESSEGSAEDLPEAPGAAAGEEAEPRP
jgi:preprotein translocase subunit YajC